MELDNLNSNGKLNDNITPVLTSPSFNPKRLGKRISSCPIKIQRGYSNSSNGRLNATRSNSSSASTNVNANSHINTNANANTNANSNSNSNSSSNSTINTITTSNANTTTTITTTTTTTSIPTRVRSKWWYRPLVHSYSAISGSDLESSRMYIDTTIVPLYSQLKSNTLLPERSVLKEVIGFGTTPIIRRRRRRKREGSQSSQGSISDREDTNSNGDGDDGSGISSSRQSKRNGSTSSVSNTSASNSPPSTPSSTPSTPSSTPSSMNWSKRSKKKRTPTSPPTSPPSSPQLFQQILPLALICSSLTAFILPLYDGAIIYYIRWIMTIISTIIGPRLTGGLYPSLGVLIFGLMINKPLAICTMALAAWVTFFLALVMTKALGLGNPLDEYND